MRRSTGVRFSALLAVATMGLAACGDDDKDAGGAQTQATKPETVALKVTGTPSAMQVTGAKEVKAGPVTITTENATKGPVDLQIVRVAGDKTAADVLKITNSDAEGQPIPAWLEGGAGTGTTTPGATGKATQVLQPGRYFIIASAETDGESKPATAEMNVTGTASGSLPQADASIAASEYAFAAQGLKSGNNPVRFANNGKELHHVIALPISQGKTIDDVKTFFRTEKGQPPVAFDQGVTTPVIDGGEEQVIDLDLKPGKYALVCFITDRKGGPPHVAKGMISETTVQ